MDRILRGEPGWQQAIGEALARAPRPLVEPTNVRTLDGDASLERFDRRAMPPARRASTLLLLYPDADGDLTIPLTVRRPDLRTHAGEVSLPGGSVDRTDASREAAALREAHEEIGVEPQSVRLIGTLDDIWIPVTNFELRPFVGTLVERPQMVPQDREVAAIVELPLRLILSGEILGEEEIEVRGLRLRAAVYRHAGQRIWGATQRTLAMLVAALDSAG
jgi:8-oxo-dGTP pyrophosphatase MutT (NUDIX family)